MNFECWAVGTWEAGSWEEGSWCPGDAPAPEQPTGAVDWRILYRARERERRRMIEDEEILVL